MAKFDVASLTEMLNDAQSNKDLLNDLAGSVERYVNNQRRALDEIEMILENARAGKLSGKGKRGPKAGVKTEKPEILGDNGAPLDRRSKEYKRRLAEMNS